MAGPRLTPKKYQSAETNYTGRSSKTGDKEVQWALYKATNVILILPVSSVSPRSSSWPAWVTWTLSG
jgi:transposase